MRNARPFLFLALVLYATSGCSCSNPTKEQIEAFDKGEPPKREKATADIYDHLKTVLKDPNSAQVEIEPQVFAFGYCYDEYRKPVIGWRVPVKVNGKNSFGGYTGYKTWVFLWQHGQLVHAREGR